MAQVLGSYHLQGRHTDAILHSWPSLNYCTHLGIEAHLSTLSGSLTQALSSVEETT